MRYAWISLLVVALDQGLKWLIATPWLTANYRLELGPLIATLLGHEIPAARSLDAVVSNSTALVLLAALLSLLLLFGRWGNQLHFISRKTMIALQLAGGGMTAQVADLAFRGDAYSTFQLGIHGLFLMQSSIADLALMAGFILLLDILLRGGSRVQSRVTLAPANIAPLGFSHLPRGIDNIHIDVYLSPRFRKATERLVHTLVPQVIQQLQQGKRKTELPPRLLAEYRADFNELLNASLRKAKSSGEKQLPNLFLVAVLKLVHGEINNAVAAQLQQAKDGNNAPAMRGLKARSNAELIEWLFRYREQIIALTGLALLQGIHEDRGDPLEKRIRHFLGQKRLFALQALESPMVLSESPTCAMVQREHYMLLGQQQSDANSFVNIDNLLRDTFREYLELVENSENAPDKVSGYLRDAGGINSNTIDTLSQPSVLMHPGNIAILLDPTWTERKLKKTSKLKDLRRYSMLRQHLHFQQRLREKLKYVLKRSGLARWIVTTYQVHELLKQGNSDIPPSQLIALLARPPAKGEFADKLQELLRGARRPPAEEAVLKLRATVYKEQDKLLEQYLLRFLHNFAHYRRDLLLLLSYQRAAAEITLLTEPADVETSRANYTLYEFLHQSEDRSEHAAIRSHIIIKV